MKRTWVAILSMTIASLATACAEPGFEPLAEAPVEEPVDLCPPEDQETFYADADGDGFGDPENSISDCVAAVGYVSDNTDCDDLEGFAYPGGLEVCGDQIDNDCSAGDACVDNLAARWAFTAVDGTVVDEDSGNLLPGILEGGLVNTPEASLTFDGSDDYALFEDAETYQLAAGSVALWFNAATVDANQALLSKDSAGNDTGGHLTAYLDVGGRVRVRLQSNNASYQVAALPVGTNSWHHLVFNFGGNEGMSLYVDGVEAGRDPYTGGMLRNYEPLVIGAATDTSGDLTALPISRPFAGDITEVQFYDRQLVAEEVAGLRTTTAPVGALP